MSAHIPAGARPIHITDEPLDVQLVDLTLACSAQDPDLRIACVAVWIDLDHHQAGSDPALMPLDRVWSPPTPLDESALWRWAEIGAVAKGIHDVRPQLAAEVERLSDDLAALTIWPVAERRVPGVRRAQVVNGMLRSQR